MSKLAHSNQATMDLIEGWEDEARPVERRIITSHEFPPIPDRRFDWMAYREGNEEGPRGFGATEEAAIADLDCECRWEEVTDRYEACLLCGATRLIINPRRHHADAFGGPRR